jgi:putative ABC transport system permease protein
MNILSIKQVLRSLRKNKLYSFITILGLAIGMAATILLFIYSQHELSFDRFNWSYKRIFRLISIYSEERQTVPICLRLGDSTLQKAVPEIEELYQFYSVDVTELVKEDQRFKNIPFIYSDPNIHKVLSVKYIHGNPEDALSTPGALVLTRSQALRIFGSTDVIGRTLTESDDLYTVKGVIDDLPVTSSVQLGAIASMQSLQYLNYLSGLEFATYVKFRENADIENAVRKTELVYNELLRKRFEGSGYPTDCFLQKMSDIHLKSDFQSKNGYDNPLRMVYLYCSMALLVLLIALINFINLLTVQYEGRSKEIGIQKAIGASRRHIIVSFLGRSMVFSIVALIAATILVEFLIPSFGAILNRELVSTYRNNILLIIGLPTLSIFTGLISGIYPALFISKYPPYLAIKGNTVRKKGGNRIIQALVVLQFSIAILLISGLLVVNQQLKYMKTADLGFNAHDVITLSNLNEKLIKAYPSIKNSLLKLPFVKSVGASTHFMGGGASGQGIDVISETGTKQFPINQYRVLSGFLETYQFRFIMGRPFNDSIESDKSSIVLTESALRMLGIVDPSTANLMFKDQKVHILGVVKDFNYASLEKPIEPIMFTLTAYLYNISIRVDGEDTHKTLSAIEGVMREFDSGYVMDYTLMEDYFQSRYRRQEQMSTLVTYASILAIILALLGLYSLSMFMVQKRIKEIGVRKVNGASRVQIVVVLLSAYTRQVLIAFIIATPIAYLLLKGWLNNFAFRVNLTLYPILMAGLIAIIVVWLTVLGQTLRAASVNPIESLRYE